MSGKNLPILALVLLSACSEYGTVGPIGGANSGRQDATVPGNDDSAAPLASDDASSPDTGIDVSEKDAQGAPAKDSSTPDVLVQVDTFFSDNFDCTLWDYTANKPCPAGLYNCDCASSCASTTSCSGSQDAGVVPPPTGGYETKFHHTSTGSSDGGKSLILCPGQKMDFDSCKCGTVTIPRHGDDNGRETYWNMFQVPIGDIICTKNGKTYKYRADQTWVFGEC